VWFRLGLLAYLSGVKWIISTTNTYPLIAKKFGFINVDWGESFEKDKLNEIWVPLRFLNKFTHSLTFKIDSLGNNDSSSLKEIASVLSKYYGVHFKYDIGISQLNKESSYIMQITTFDDMQLLNYTCLMKGFDLYSLIDLCCEEDFPYLDLGFKGYFSPYYIFCICNFQLWDRVYNTVRCAQTPYFVKTFTGFLFNSVEDFPDLVILREKYFIEWVKSNKFTLVEVPAQALSGAFKDSEGHSHYIQISGHFYSVMLLFHFYATDIKRYLDSIELNVKVYSGKNDHLVKTYKKIIESGNYFIVELAKTDYKSLWHSYYEYVIAIDIYKILALYIFGNINTSLVDYCSKRLDDILFKLPKFLDHSKGALLYLQDVEKL
jgi:hypothetical protein